MRKSLSAAVAAVAAAVLAAPAAADAHVTLQPQEVPAGGFTRLNVRVPNERDDASTTKVDVQLPGGFEFVSYEPVPGWKVKIARQKKEVRRVTFTGSEKSAIAPGQFRDFGLSVGVPEGKPGDKLTFKAVQTYSSGEIVRWIGPEDGETPAPTVALTTGEDGGHAAAAPAAAASPVAATTDDGGGSDGLAIAALVVGALGLLAGVGALVAARRTRAGAARG